MNRFPTRSRNPSPQAVPNTTGSQGAGGGGGNHLDSSFSNLPANMLDAVVSLLEPSDVVSLTDTNRAVRDTLAMQRSDALITLITETAAGVTTRDGFMNALGPEGTVPTDRSNSIRSLPLHLQAAPLETLALRIRSFEGQSDNDMYVAKKEFLAQFNVLNEANQTTTTLTDMAHVAKHSVEDSESNGIQGHDPFSTVFHGANVQHTARFYGVHADTLESAAVFSTSEGSAGTAVANGRNVRDVANEHGITSPHRIHELEVIAIESTEAGSAGTAARSARQNNENVADIASRFGIFSTAGTNLLTDEVNQQQV